MGGCWDDWPSFSSFAFLGNNYYLILDILKQLLLFYDVNLDSLCALGIIIWIWGKDWHFVRYYGFGEYWGVARHRDDVSSKRGRMSRIVLFNIVQIKDVMWFWNSNRLDHS